MLRKPDQALPSIQKAIETKIQQALENHAVTRGSSLEADLRGRIQVLSGYGGDLLIRAVDDSRALVTPDAYLKQRLDGTVDSLPKRTTGPFRVSKYDSELIHATVAEIAGQGLGGQQAGNQLNC